MNAEASLPVIHKVAWTPIRDRKILFARSRGQTLFFSVGGKPNPGEPNEAALIREVEEETSVLLFPDTIKLANTFRGPSGGAYEGKATLRMDCYFAEFLGMVEPRSEIEELKWLSLNDFRLTTPLGHIMLLWYARCDYID